MDRQQKIDFDAAMIRGHLTNCGLTDFQIELALFLLARGTRETVGDHVVYRLSVSKRKAQQEIGCLSENTVVYSAAALERLGVLQVSHHPVTKVARYALSWTLLRQLDTPPDPATQFDREVVKGGQGWSKVVKGGQSPRDPPRNNNNNFNVDVDVVVSSCPVDQAAAVRAAGNEINRLLCEVGGGTHGLYLRFVMLMALWRCGHQVEVWDGQSRRPVVLDADAIDALTGGFRSRRTSKL